MNQALNPLAFPLRGSRLIEASAGTGKTWAIAALYIRLILGHGEDATAFDRALLPPEILVVTFTEAATKELRDRIRKRLHEAALCFRKQGQPDAFLQGLAASYRAEQHPACARRLDIAAQWMDEAAVHTIHSWCNRMLRQHAFDSGSLFNLEIDATDTELLTESARDYWRTFFYPLDGSSCRAVAKLAGSPDALLALLKRLLRETEAEWRIGDHLFQTPTSPDILLKRWADWDGQRRQHESHARSAWSKDRAAIEQWLGQASKQGWLNGNSYRQSNFTERLHALAHWAKTGEACDPKWLEGFAQNRFKMNKAHQDKLLQHPAFAALDDLLAHQTQEPDITQELLVHAAFWIRARFAQEKQNRAKMDFDDLLVHLDRALHRPSGMRLAEVIRKQYPVALIDEFQDTDPLQYRIFTAVYPLHENHAATGLFMIGDPKQAIYSFRGADIHAYLKARNATEGRHYTLGRNFRSTQPMVDAVNRIFGHAEAQIGGAFKFRAETGANPLPFQTVQAEGRTESWMVEGHPASALTIWHLPPRENDNAYPLGEYRDNMADTTAGEITRLLNLAKEGQAGFQSKTGFAPLQPADIAILVRDHIEASAIRDALASRKLRSVYLSDRSSVFDTQEAGDLLHWLKACAEPERDRCLRAALGTSTLDLSYATLESLNRDELRWEQEVERFRGYRVIWRYQGVLPMLRRLMADFDVPARLLARADGERTLTNLLHLAELMQAASAELDGEQALIRHLAETRDSQDQARDETLLRLESDADLIQVVTIHKSKGLEYPLVFLPFICSFREVSGKQRYYRFHDAQGRLQIDLGKTDTARQKADLERLQEDLRLLYVALTRARHACWLGIAPVKSGNVKACQLDKSAVGHLLRGGSSLKAEELGASLAALKGDCEAILIIPPPAPHGQVYKPPAEDLPLEPARAFTGRIAEHWWIASYSALKLEEEGPIPETRAVEPPDTPRQANLEEEADKTEQATANLPPLGALNPHRFPRGAKPGTFLHGLLEWAAREGFGKVTGDSSLLEDTVARRCHVRGWLGWKKPLSDWLRRLIDTPMALPDSSVALAALDKHAYQPELEFWFAASHVDALALDRLTTQHTLDGVTRPRLAKAHINGMLKGFIDLVFEHQGRYYVADYKSNWLGADDQAYTGQAMREAVLEKRYELQYTIYLLALHRLLKVRLRDTYDYDRHIGGAVYLFLRGIDGPAGGLHVEKPPRRLIETLDSLFAGQEAHDGD